MLPCPTEMVWRIDDNYSSRKSLWSCLYESVVLWCNVVVRLMSCIRPFISKFKFKKQRTVLRLEGVRCLSMDCLCCDAADTEMNRYWGDRQLDDAL